ncbi:MAG: YXWGXW repeat-containing protein, partial [Desulfobacteraceae bacterium]|nr:YXWGXW repeat-containing protein [Desulfobacteraceae bacterium]
MISVKHFLHERPPCPDSWIPGCWVWHLGRYAWRPGY